MWVNRFFPSFLLKSNVNFEEIMRIQAEKSNANASWWSCAYRGYKLCSCFVVFFFMWSEKLKSKLINDKKLKNIHRSIRTNGFNGATKMTKHFCFETKRKSLIIIKKTFFIVFFVLIAMTNEVPFDLRRRFIVLQFL